MCLLLTESITVHAATVMFCCEVDTSKRFSGHMIQTHTHISGKQQSKHVLYKT